MISHANGTGQFCFPALHLQICWLHLEQLHIEPWHSLHVQVSWFALFSRAEPSPDLSLHSTSFQWETCCYDRTFSSFVNDKYSLVRKYGNRRKLHSGAWQGKTQNYLQMNWTAALDIGFSDRQETGRWSVTQSLLYSWNLRRLFPWLPGSMQKQTVQEDARMAKPSYVNYTVYTL